MKKCLVLMLVLGIASMATATLTISAPATIDVGATVSIAIVADAASAAQTGDASGGYVTALGTYHTYISGFVMEPGAAAGTMSGYSYNASTGYIYVNGSNLGTEDLLSPGDWLSFDLGTGALAVGDVITIALNNGQSVGIDVVPEPMTIGLLGLGGLFLRRRK